MVGTEAGLRFNGSPGGRNVWGVEVGVAGVEGLGDDDAEEGKEISPDGRIVIRTAYSS
jgi:hypothetical protein